MPECERCGRTHATVNEAEWVNQSFRMCPKCWAQLCESRQGLAIDRCPGCGSDPAEVSWQTAPGQQVCPEPDRICAVNTWGGAIDDE